MKSNINNMMCLDMYASSLNKDDAILLQPLLTAKNHSTTNLISWDIHVQNFNKLSGYTKVEKEMIALKEMAKIYQWKNDFDEILVNNNFEALILTDISRKIIWVNDGFATMTGYSKSFAVNKTPSFLQGSYTSEDTRLRIREKLKANKPFKEVIINHKKDETAYKCELSIFPLYGENTTHFLALEKEAV